MSTRILLDRTLSLFAKLKSQKKGRFSFSKPAETLYFPAENFVVSPSELCRSSSRTFFGLENTGGGTRGTLRDTPHPY